jgi:23S rRNA G2069 N7-methylase RlmK/C1962 C5-methylase RlmI
LLFDRPLEFYFIALMQIEKDDKAMYAKIKNLTNDDIKTITDANGFRILLNKAEFTPGWITLDGNLVSRCADGQNPIADFFNKLLFCDIRRPIIELQNKQDMWWLWLVVGAGCAAIIVAVVVFRKKGHVPRQTAQRQQTQQTTVAMARRSAMFPAKLLCPATVSFEYQLVPGHLI